VRNGKPVLSAEEHVADFPLLTPSIAVSSVGAGGGSIIWLDEAGGLKVGPRSVGADPGPACYGKGKGIAALTDAFLLTGWLADGQKLGGRIPLDRAAARAALAPIGRTLGVSPEEVADAAISVAIAIMAAETGNVVAKRGIDAPEFSLVAFGGAGPLIGALLAEEAYIDRVIIPPAPGALSALGAAHANVEGDLIVPVYQRLHGVEADRLLAVAEQLESEARAWLAEEGETVPLESSAITFSADMRYEGQGYDVTVPVEAAWLQRGDRDAIAAAFHKAHAAAYGHADESGEIWLKEVRGHVVGHTAKPAFAPVRKGTGVVPQGRRALRIHGQDVAAALYRREQLGAGDRFSGPAIVDQLDTTTLVPPDWDATLTAAGVLVLTRRKEGRA